MQGYVKNKLLICEEKKKELCFQKCTKPDLHLKKREEDEGEG